jgi:hypothetical protein
MATVKADWLGPETKAANGTNETWSADLTRGRNDEHDPENRDQLNNQWKNQRSSAQPWMSGRWIWWPDQKRRREKIKPETWNSKSAQRLTRTVGNKM